MVLIGSDFHPSWQQVSWLNQETGETGDVKLVHEAGAVEKFYRQFPAGSRIGMEATGNCQWFLELLAKLGHEVWVGDAAKIRASAVAGGRTLSADLGSFAGTERSAAAIGSSSRASRLSCFCCRASIHRHKLVRIRVQGKNGLQHLAMNQGLQKKKQLWSASGQQALRALPLAPWASRRREDLLKMRSELDAKIDALDMAVVKAAEQDERARLLMTQPGVGPITSMAFVLTMGDVSRFQRGKQVASYLGLIPREYSSGGHQRLGSISKQGNSFLRMLVVEAAQSVVRYDESFRNEYLHRCHGKPKGVAKVAAARKLAIRLYWMLRSNTKHPEIVHVESSSRVPLVGATCLRQAS